MTERERDAAVAECVMGRRFWSERRGDYKLAVMDVRLAGYPKGSWHEPWKMSRSKSTERYERISWSEAAAMGYHGTGPAHYTTDPADDYLVLGHVRENWDEMEVLKFSQSLDFIQKTRALEYDASHGSIRSAFIGTVQIVMFMEPGDYSHAAFLALERE
jgi:hypothetical protein